MDSTQYPALANRLQQVAEEVDKQVKNMSIVFNLPTDIVYNILIDVLRVQPGAIDKED